METRRRSRTTHAEQAVPDDSSDSSTDGDKVAAPPSAIGRRLARGWRAAKTAAPWLALCFALNVMLVASSAPRRAQPFYWVSRAGDLVVDAYGLAGAVLGHVYAHVVHYLDAVLRRIGPALRQTLSDVFHFLLSPFLGIPDFFERLRETIGAWQLASYIPSWSVLALSPETTALLAWLLSITCFMGLFLCLAIRFGP